MELTMLFKYGLLNWLADLDTNVNIFLKNIVFT